MDLKLLTVTLATALVAFRMEGCGAQFFPNLFNNGNNNQFPSLFPTLNNQNERPAPNWPYVSNPTQQQQIQQGLNDQVGQGQPSKNSQSWQPQSAYQPQQSQQQPYGGGSKENNYFNNNPFFNFGFPGLFGNNNPQKQRPYQNQNSNQPSYQQQAPSGTPEYSEGQQQQQPTYQAPIQPQQPSYQSPAQQAQPSYQTPAQQAQPSYQTPTQQQPAYQQQQPIGGNPEYSGGKQRPGILPSSYQNQTPNQQGYQQQNENQPGYQNSEQPGYQSQNGGYQNPQYVPRPGSGEGLQTPQQQPQRPIQQGFDDGQYRPDKYGAGGGGYQPSYNSPNNNYAPSQQQHQQPHERDLVGDLRLNGSGLGDQSAGLEQEAAPVAVPASSENAGDPAQPINWTYPDD